MTIINTLNAVLAAVSILQSKRMF